MVDLATSSYYHRPKGPTDHQHRLAQRIIRLSTKYPRFEYRFIHQLLYECLNQEIFFSIAETQVVVEDYRCFYNEERPNSSLTYKTPNDFARMGKNNPADWRLTSHPK
jgi:hypothetical protein